MREPSSWSNRSYVWTDKNIETFKRMFYEEMRTEAEIADWFKTSLYSVRKMFQEKNFKNRNPLLVKSHGRLNFKWREYENKFKDRPKKEMMLWQKINCSVWGTGPLEK